MAELLSELLARVRSGDRSAVAVLVARFQPRAVEFAAALLGDSHLAEDAVQNAFIKALGRLSDLREANAFPGWFRQIVRTEALALTRRRSVEGPGGGARDAPEAPVHAAVRDEMCEVVRAALAALPPRGRETAQLFYLGELDCPEVARRLDVPIGTVKRRLHDARKKLRELLSGYFES
jgi:RNA polymerase sigma-70 factor (ECF subfamily)